MKQFLFQITLAGVTFCPLLRGEDAQPSPATSSVTTTPTIVGPAREFEPPPRRQLVADVPESQVLQRSRVATGGRTVTIEELIPPEGAPLVEQASVPTFTPEEIAARRAAWLANRRAHPIVMLSLSGTIYDHKATLLRWRHGVEEYEAWSNIDFNVMRGVPSVQVGNTNYDLVMMLGDQSTAPRRTKSGLVITPRVPTIPQLPKVPGFVIVKGDPLNEYALRGIRALHELYTTNREKLVAAHEDQLHYQAAAQAWEKEHPPQPENVTIRWWRGRRDQEATSEAQPAIKPEGGQP